MYSRLAAGRRHAVHVCEMAIIDVAAVPKFDRTIRLFREARTTAKQPSSVERCMRTTEPTECCFADEQGHKFTSDLAFTEASGLVFLMRELSSQIERVYHTEARRWFIHARLHLLTHQVE